MREETRPLKRLGKLSVNERLAEILKLIRGTQERRKRPTADFTAVIIWTERAVIDDNKYRAFQSLYENMEEEKHDLWVQGRSWAVLMLHGLGVAATFALLGQLAP